MLGCGECEALWKSNSRIHDNFTQLFILAREYSIANEFEAAESVWHKCDRELQRLEDLGRLIRDHVALKHS
jgi:hypothetical protein